MTSQAVGRGPRAGSGGDGSALDAGDPGARLGQLGAGSGASRDLPRHGSGRRSRPRRPTASAKALPSRYWRSLASKPSTQSSRRIAGLRAGRRSSIALRRRATFGAEIARGGVHDVLGVALDVAIAACTSSIVSRAASEASSGAGSLSRSSASAAAGRRRRARGPRASISAGETRRVARVEEPSARARPGDARSHGAAAKWTACVTSCRATQRERLGGLAAERCRGGVDVGADEEQPRGPPRRAAGTRTGRGRGARRGRRSAADLHRQQPSRDRGQRVRGPAPGSDALRPLLGRAEQRRASTSG